MTTTPISCCIWASQISVLICACPFDAFCSSSHTEDLMYLLFPPVFLMSLPFLMPPNLNNSPESVCVWHNILCRDKDGRSHRGYLKVRNRHRQLLNSLFSFMLAIKYLLVSARSCSLPWASFMSKVTCTMQWGRQKSVREGKKAESAWSWYPYGVLEWCSRSSVGF